LYWSDGLAQAGRIPPYDTDRALIVSVAAVDDRILTTPTAALIAKLVNAVSENPVAIIDTDGMNQPVRAALGAHRGGDFFGLVNQSAHDKHQAKPPYGIEHEEKSKGHQTACHATYSCRVCGNLPPNVDKRANHLHNEGGNQYAGHETRYL